MYKIILRYFCAGVDKREWALNHLRHCSCSYYKTIIATFITVWVYLSQNCSGPLKSVSNVIRQQLNNQESLSYFWEPPPSLDLTDIEPDIVYCVQICNITCGHVILLHDMCGLTNPVFMHDGLDPSYVYQINVVPRSNVPGASNGTLFSRNGNQYDWIDNSND